VTSDTISRYFSTADLGLQPDRKSALSDLCSMLKTIEYMAFGLPVVALDLRETRRMTGSAALLLQEPDPAAFADAVEHLLDDPDLRSTMAEEGQVRAHGPLAWEHSAAVYVNVVGGLTHPARQRTSTSGAGGTAMAAAWSS
jgi:glycosyltransferase involved in cell wall biosynthesis